MTPLDFEKPIVELETQIEDLRKLAGTTGTDIVEEIGRLQVKADRLKRQTYAKLTPAQKVKVARHPERPHMLDYVAKLVADFVPLAGDRLFGEDAALVGGIGRFRGRSCLVLGQEKGHDTETRIKHNFGAAKPEGYRKAQRLMDLAERFSLPVISFIDTAGAYPGVGAEERGQAEAIAKSIERSLRLPVPIVSVVIGEGGSGGAIAIATADRILMLEHAIYSVISPEGCASILWRSGSHAQDAAAALRLTAQDLKELAVIDEIIPEPMGGAHRQAEETIKDVGERIEQALTALRGIDGATLVSRRRTKFLDMGQKGLA
jgi:acetyl-CoA carboxylase carboxyl transferase subunit alpha